MCPGPGISVHRDFHVNMRCIVVLFEGFQVAVASISIGGRSSTCDRVCAHEASIHQLQMPPPPKCAAAKHGSAVCDWTASDVEAEEVLHQ